MSNNAIALLAFVITYIITRLGFWLFKFNPFNTLSFWRGLIADFAIWVLTYFIIYWVIKKLMEKQR